MYQQIDYINKMGAPMSEVVKILKRKSKVIVCMRLEDEKVFEIPRNAVGKIATPVKLEKGKE